MHTKKPWVTWSDEINVYGPNGEMITNIPNTCSLKRTEQKANAVLIAKAPDMLYALRGVLERVHFGDGLHPKIVNEIREIIDEINE